MWAAAERSSERVQPKMFTVWHVWTLVSVNACESLSRTVSIFNPFALMNVSANRFSHRTCHRFSISQRYTAHCRNPSDMFVMFHGHRNHKTNQKRISPDTIPSSWDSLTPTSPFCLFSRPLPRFIWLLFQWFEVISLQNSFVNNHE